MYKAVEFTGPALAGMSLSERMALCNMTTEMGAKASYIHPDAVTLAHLRDKGLTSFDIPATDPGFVYAAEHVYDVSTIGPQLSVPFSVGQRGRPARARGQARGPGLPWAPALAGAWRTSP